MERQPPCGKGSSLVPDGGQPLCCHCEGGRPKQSHCPSTMPYFVYILTNAVATVLYTGVTSDLKKRLYEHREKSIDGFTKNYRVSRLVYYESFDDVREAITREKQLKAGSRKQKMALVD